MLENDDIRFSAADVLWIHARTGVRCIFDYQHFWCLNPERLDLRETLARVLATWPAGVRPKIHFSSPRTELREIRQKITPKARAAAAEGTAKAKRGEVLKAPVKAKARVRTVLRPPIWTGHADFTNPFEFATFMRTAAGLVFDVMMEGKSKDLSILPPAPRPPALRPRRRSPLRHHRARRRNPRGRRGAARDGRRCGRGAGRGRGGWGIGGGSRVLRPAHRDRAGPDLRDFPAKGGIAVGSDAGLVLWDPSRETVLTNALLHSACDDTPYEARRVRGWSATTIARGAVVWHAGELRSRARRGGSWAGVVGMV